MSTDHAGDAGQPTLTESIASRVNARRQRRRERLSERPAEYGKTPTGADAESEPDDAGCCLTCGDPIESRLVRRVAGDDWGRTVACASCTDHASDAKAASREAGGRL